MNHKFKIGYIVEAYTKNRHDILIITNIRTHSYQTIF